MKANKDGGTSVGFSNSEYAPITNCVVKRTHNGFIVYAQSESDFRNKVNKINRGDTDGFEKAKGIIELIKENHNNVEYNADNFKISDVPELKTPEMILLDALETIIKVGKDWEWSEDFWAIRIAKEALSEYSKKPF